MKKIPCFTFPTTVVLVDDDEKFLRWLSPSLDDNLSRFQTFSNPQKAIEFLNDNHSKPSFKNTAMTHVDSIDLENRGISVNVSKINEETKNDEKLDQVSIVIADYSMPRMNGLEFLQKITNPFIKKILLTATADEIKAVEAFNNGIIDFYTKKSGNDMVEALNNTIKDFQKKYFFDVTSILSSSILENKEQFTALRDPNFIKFFDDLVADMGIIEYYLTETIGSFLLVDAQGKKYQLFIRNEDNMEAIADIAEQTPNLPETVVSSLKDRNKMLCFEPKEGETFDDLEDWEPYLADAKPVPGTELKYAIRSVSEPR